MTQILRQLSVNDGGFIQWVRQGFTALCLLVDNQEFIDFKTMSERYDLAQRDIYRYLQLRHYFDKNVKLWVSPHNLDELANLNPKIKQGGDLSPNCKFQFLPKP